MVYYDGILLIMSFFCRTEADRPTLADPDRPGQAVPPNSTGSGQIRTDRLGRTATRFSDSHTFWKSLLRNLNAIRTLIGCPCNFFPGPYRLQQRADARTSFSKPSGTSRQVRTSTPIFHFHSLFMYTTFSIGTTSCMVKIMSMLFPTWDLLPRHSGALAVLVDIARRRTRACRETRVHHMRDWEPFYTFTAQSRKFL
jgi:hypothetical protein